MIVDQPVDLAVLTTPATEAEQLIIVCASHAVQHGNLLFADSTITLECP